jgi:hypothetical protein
MFFVRERRYPSKLPFTPGQEAAGTATAVGEGVTEIQGCSRVAWCSILGTYAEFAVAPADRVVAIPNNVTFECPLERKTPIRNLLRRLRLGSERSGQALARHPGLLELRRSPCIREHCPACLAGEQHSSYVLDGRAQGRRYGLYVPEE